MKILIVLLIILLTSFVSAETLQGTNFNSSSTIIDSGGINMSSSNFFNYPLLESLTGILSSSNFNNFLGFWFETNSSNLTISSPSNPSNIGSSGSGGVFVSPLVPNSYVCKKTYDYINKYDSNNFLHLGELQQDLSLNNYSVSLTDLQNYLLIWQPLCSEMINKTLQEPVVCERIYYFLIQGNNSYNDFTLNNLRLSIKTTQNLDVSNKLLKNYIENYDNKCLYNKPLPFKKTFSVLNIKKIIQEAPVCSVNTDNSFVDSKIPFFSIGLGTQSCEQIDLKRWFFALEKNGENYDIVGIRLWVIVTLLIISLSVYYAFFLKRRNKRLKQLLKEGNFLKPEILGFD